MICVGSTHESLDTHKFESRYLDRLIAPLPAGRAVYESRAPIRHLEGFCAPLITFQGAQDKGVPVVYIEFEDEQHGFRKAVSIERSLEAELAFYGEVFGFTPAGTLPPIQWIGSNRPVRPASRPSV
jgi:hypothetical protein